MVDDNRIEELEKKLKLLTSERDLTRRILEDAVDSFSLPMAVGENGSFEEVLEQASYRLSPLIKLKSMAFYLLSNDGLDFYCAWSDSARSRSVLEGEKNLLVEDGTVAWALNRNKPVMVTSKDDSSYVLLHSLMAQDEPMGLFIAHMVEDPGDVMDISLAFVTVILSSTASIINSIRLYRVIKELNEELQAKVTSLQKSESELATANRAKDNFLANIGHEIRTPLNAILGTAALLQGSPVNRVSSGLSIIRREGAALLALINDILDISKVEAGQMDFESVPFDLYEIITGVSELYKGNALLKGLKMEFFIDPDLPSLLMGDPVRIRQVLSNLLGNAVKFTDKGRISLIVKVLSKEDDKVFLHVSVKDTGIGITESGRKELFRAFSQVDSSTTRRCGGTGLGLAISQKIVEMMGSKIKVDSTPGVGTTFYFKTELPIAKDNRLISHQVLSPYGGDDNNIEALNVLIVEDNPTNLFVAREMIKRFGHRVREAESGRDALQFLTEGYFDLIFMDIQMPGMDGIETTEIIRDRNSSVCDHDVPIVALTANAMEGDRNKYIEAGMNDYLAKPILLEDLGNMVKKYDRRDLSGEKSGKFYVLDRASLEKRMGNDTLLAEAVLNTFLEDLQVIFKNIEKSLEEKDGKAMRLHSHSLKGAASNVGAHSLRDCAYRLQKASEEALWDKIPYLVESLEKEKRQLSHFLEEE